MQKILAIFFFILATALPANAENAFIKNLQHSSNLQPTDNGVQNFLPEEQAFPFSASLIDATTLQLSWQPAKGYYLYRHSMAIQSLDTILDHPIIPQGQLEYDEYLGNYQTYHEQVQITVPIQRHEPQSLIHISFQGCAASGYCYPPMSRTVNIDWSETTIVKQTTPTYPILLHVDKISSQKAIMSTVSKSSTPDTPTASAPTASADSPIAKQDQIKDLLLQQYFFLSLLAFFGFGLLLAFTPCVLPMLPILAGLVLGQGKKLSSKRTLVLASVYVLALATTYSIAGAMAAMLGHNLQVTLQKPWVLSITAAFFLALAFSLFGYYELRLPKWLDHKLHHISRKQQGGSLISAGLLGILSALIVSPCVTAPLVGALAYISQTGDVVLGGSALFALGIGMGLPLIIFVTLGAAYIPKSGHWMEHVKRFFGVLLVAVAIAILARFIPGQFSLFLWGSLSICVAVYLGAFRQAKNIWQRLNRGIGLIFFVLGACYIIGALQGNSDVLQPLSSDWERSSRKSQVSTNYHKREVPVSTVAELQQQLQQAKSANKPVMVAFSADWCLSCKIMERNVINTLPVQAMLADFVVLTVDVTENTSEDRAIMAHLGVFAPPSFIFFDQHGRDLAGARLVAETSQEHFLASLLHARQQ